MRSLHFVLSALASFSIVACNSNNNTTNTSYLGIWDVRYNLSTDDCQLVTPGITGFVSEHDISELDDGTMILTSNDTFITEATATQSDGILTAIEDLSGDLFGDGSFCTQTSSVGYSQLNDNDATTLFEFRLECNDGFLCVSQALGQATRRS